MDPLDWLQTWYFSQSQFPDFPPTQIEIRTYDNPGWGLEIQLQGSSLNAKPFSEINEDLDEDDWYFCRVIEGKFEAAGGPFNLFEILHTFSQWMNPYPAIDALQVETPFKPYVSWLQNWYFTHCDGDWEHCFQNVRIGTKEDNAWEISLNLEETEFESTYFEEVRIQRNEMDWLHCVVKENQFKAVCGPLNLCEVIEIFHQWVSTERA